MHEIELGRFVQCGAARVYVFKKSPCCNRPAFAILDGDAMLGNLHFNASDALVMAEALLNKRPHYAHVQDDAWGVDVVGARVALHLKSAGRTMCAVLLVDDTAKQIAGDLTWCAVGKEQKA